MHEVVREHGEGEGVAQGLLERLLPVRDALHARHGSASACDALEFQLARQLPDAAVHDGVGERAPDRDGYAFLRDGGVFAEVRDAQLARPRLASVLPPDAGGVGLRAGCVGSVRHRDERAFDAPAPVGDLQLRVRVPPDVLRGGAQRLEVPLPDGQGLAPDLRGRDGSVSKQGERLARLGEGAERGGQPRDGLRGERRHLPFDAEGPEHVEFLWIPHAVRVSHLGPAVACDGLPRPRPVHALAASPGRDGGHDLSLVGGHVLRHGLREVPVEVRERLLPVPGLHALERADEVEDVDEARAGEDQESSAVFFRASSEASATSLEYSASSLRYRLPFSRSFFTRASWSFGMCLQRCSPRFPRVWNLYWGFDLFRVPSFVA